MFKFTLKITHLTFKCKNHFNLFNLVLFELYIYWVILALTVTVYMIERDFCKM